MTKRRYYEKCFNFYSWTFLHKDMRCWAMAKHSICKAKRIGYFCWQWKNVHCCPAIFPKAWSEELCLGQLRCGWWRFVHSVLWRNYRFNATTFFFFFFHIVWRNFCCETFKSKLTRLATDQDGGEREIWTSFNGLLWTLKKCIGVNRILCWAKNLVFSIFKAS